MSTPLSAFLPFVLPHVPGCPDFAAKQEILRAAIRFCGETRAWKTVPAVVNIVAETSTYAIPVPIGGQVGLIESVQVNGKRIDPISLDDLEAQYPDWTTAIDAEVKRYTQLDADSLILHPAPLASLAGGLKILASFKPAPAATAVPDLLFNEFTDEIAAGALAKLLAVPGKPWSNPPLAGYYADLFGKAIGSANCKAAKSFTRVPLRTTPRSR